MKLDFVDKSFYRRKTNQLIQSKLISGSIVDLGGGNRASYLSYFKIKKGSSVISVNINRKDNPTVLSDLERTFPIANNFADVVLAFNIVEHVYYTDNFIVESKRILKKRGDFIAATPFLKEIHSDPNDFFRLTPIAWHNKLESAGFKKIEITNISFGPMIACYTLLQTILPKIMLFIIYPLCYLFDLILLKLRPNWKDVFLLGVMVKASK